MPFVKTCCLLLAVIAGTYAAAPTGDADLASARKHAAQAQAFIEAYYDHVILPRKTPTQTYEARKMRLTAWAEAEKALRRFDAYRAEKKELKSSDRELAGACRLILVDTDRPAIQSDQVRETLINAALKEFSELWKAEPENPRALACMIEANRLLMNREAGLAVINQAKVQAKKNPDFNLAAGRFFLEMEDPKSALEHLRSADSGRASDYRVKLYLAAALHMMGDAGGAKREAQAALKLRPGCEAASFLIEHIDAYNAATKGRSPGHRGSRHLVVAGQAFEQRGDHSVSIHFYEKSVEAMPENSRALYFLGESLANRARLLGRKDEAKRAAELLTKAMARGGMPDVTREAALIPLAMAYETAGDFKEAAETYRTVVESDASYYRYYTDLARCYRALGKKEQADQAMAKYEELKPKTSYMTGARREFIEQRIGISDGCDQAELLPSGDGVIKGRAEVRGQGMRFCEAQLLLDGCSRVTTPAETDEDGRFEVRLPPGNYVYNGIRITCYPGLDDPALGEMVYVPGRLEELYEVMAGGPSALTGPEPGAMPVKPGDNPELAFEARFVPRIKVTSLRPDEKIGLAEAGTRNIAWEKVPGAARYQVTLYEVNAALGGFIPLKEKLTCLEPEISMTVLFASALMAPLPGGYAMVIEAVDDEGRTIARTNGPVMFSLE